MAELARGTCRWCDPGITGSGGRFDATWGTHEAGPTGTVAIRATGRRGLRADTGADASEYFELGAFRVRAGGARVVRLQNEIDSVTVTVQVGTLFLFKREELHDAADDPIRIT